MNLEERVDALEKRLSALEAELRQKPVEIPIAVIIEAPISVRARHMVLSGKRLKVGDIVHVKKQRDPSENGLYSLDEDHKLVKLELE